MHKILLSLFVLVLVLSISHPAAALQNSQGIETGLQILRSDATGMSLRLLTPEYQLLPAGVDEPALAGYSVLQAPGLAPTTQPGEPQIPQLSKLIGVPPNSEIQILIRPGRAVTVRGSHMLAPAPLLAQDEDDSGEVQEVYSPQADMYARQDWLPASQGGVSEVFWLRGQRVARIDLAPFQYQPAQGRLLWYPELEVDLYFRPVPGAEPMSSREQSLPDGQDPFDSVLSASLLNYEQAREWQVEPGAAENGLVSAPNIPSSLTQPAYKMIVDRDGIYKVTGAQLQSAGMNLATLNPQALRLINQEREVAIYLSGVEDGRLDAADYVLFYGEKFRGDYMSSFYQNENQHWFTYLQSFPDGTYQPWKAEYNHFILEHYTQENVYWLTVQPGTPARMAIVDGDPTGSAAETPASYRTTQRAEESRIYYTQHYTNEDAWFWESITTATRTYTTTLSAVFSTAQPVIVRGEVFAVNHSASLFPDQHTRVAFNTATYTTTAISDEKWDGRSRYRFEAALPASAIIEGTNTLAYQAVNDTGVSPRHYFDWFEVEYDRKFVALGNKLDFSPSSAGEWKYQVRGFTAPNIMAFDISNPLRPNVITNTAIIGAGAEITATFVVSSPEAARYFIADSSTFLAPKSIARYTPHLRTAVVGADYIFIAHPNFITATQVLADYRATQGLRTQIISIEDIYNEFSFGIQQPQAIKDFLRWVFLNWQKPEPTFVALVGDGHWNPRGFYPAAYGTTPSYMHPNLGFVDKSVGFMDATNLLGNIVGDDLMADVALSRIPVNTEAEMMLIVNKILAYENAPIQDWQRRLLFVADHPDPSAGDFEHAANLLYDKYAHSGFTGERLFVSDYCSDPDATCLAATQALTQTLNTNGALMMVYAGHGAIQYWGIDILALRHVPSLTNAQRLPILFSLDCWDGHWYGVKGPGYASNPSLAETLLLRDGGGVIAAYSPVGLSLAGGHDIQADAFFASILEEGSWNLGSAVIAGKLKLLSLNRDLDQIHLFNILGDPALRIKSPYRVQAAPSPTGRSVQAGTQAGYTVNITNTGVLTDTFSAVVTGNQWITSAGAPVTLPPGGSGKIAITVTVPITAGIGTRDYATVAAQSQGDKAQKVTFLLTTTALYPYRMMLPMLVKPGP